MSPRDPTLPERTRRRNRGFEPASRLMAGLMKGPATKRGFAETKLLTRWHEIVGADIAEMASPVTLRYGGKQGLGGTLVVLTNGASAPLVQMREAEIVASVNACYGYRAVSRVHITQTTPTGFAEDRQTTFTPKVRPTAAPEVRAAASRGIDEIADDRLRNALTRLAGHVLGPEETSNG
ncbi:MAG: DciA family protein [Pseudomonadota bacterium]